MYIAIILSFIFLIFAAFFSGSEIGFISLDKQLLVYRERQDKKKSKIVKILYRFINSYENIIYISLIGTNISTIASVQILSRALHHRFKYSYIFLSVVYPIFSLIISEIIPKLIYSKKPYTLVRYSIFPYKFFYYLFYPLIIIFHLFDIILKKTVKNFENENKNIDNEKFYSYLKRNFNLHFKESTILIDNLITILKNKAKDISTPLDNYNLLFIDNIVSSRIEKVLDKEIDFDFFLKLLNNDFKIRVKNNSETLSSKRMLKSYFYKSDDYFLIFTKENDFIGYILIDNIFFINSKIKINKPLIVPFSMKLKDIIKEMKNYSKDVVFVIDEYNNVEGVIDRKKLFGQFYESILYNNKKSEKIQKISKNEYIVDCSIEIDKLNKILNLNFKSKYYRTLNGFILEYSGMIPETGKIIKLKKCEMIVIKSSSKEVFYVKLKIYR